MKKQPLSYAPTDPEYFSTIFHGKVGRAGRHNYNIPQSNSTVTVSRLAQYVLEQKTSKEKQEIRGRDLLAGMLDSFPTFEHNLPPHLRLMFAIASVPSERALR